MKVTRENITIMTPDHWKIALYRYLPEKITRKHPVLLLHGIASNHRVWDFGHEELSFARHLAAQGYAVYSMDLRGRAGSDGPHTGRGKQWSVDDYLLCDLPAATEYIIAQHGTEKLHWVGHSMGGILGFFYRFATRRPTCTVSPHLLLRSTIPIRPSTTSARCSTMSALCSIFL